MMKHHTKLLSILLTLVMVIGLLPTASAHNADNVITSLVFATDAPYPADGGAPFCPTLHSVNGSTDGTALAMVDKDMTGTMWYSGTGFMGAAFENGRSYDLWMQVAAANGITIDQDCTVALLVGGVEVPGVVDYVDERYNEISFNVFFDLTVSAPDPIPATMSTDVGEKTFVAGGDWVEFTFSTDANDDAGTLVYGGSDFGVLYEDKIAGLEYKAGDQWIDMKGQNFGGAGFALTDADSTFRVKFTEDAAGDYTFVASMKRVEDDSVVCSVEVPFTVQAPAADPIPDIKFPYWGLGILGGAATGFPFDDVKRTDWFYDEVKDAWENDLIDGVTRDAFLPEKELTVAQAIKLAAALHQKDYYGYVTLENGYPNWYSTYVDYAVKMGVIDGKYQNYSLSQMNTPISREEFVRIFFGAMPERSYTAWNEVADNAIPDVKLGNTYADEIYTFYRAGILTGSDAKGTFHPESSIKRSEVAAILIRMYDKTARQSVTLK